MYVIKKEMHLILCSITKRWEITQPQYEYFSPGLSHDDVDSGEPQTARVLVCAILHPRRHGHGQLQRPTLRSAQEESGSKS